MANLTTARSTKYSLINIILLVHQVRSFHDGPREQRNRYDASLSEGEEVQRQLLADQPLRTATSCCRTSKRNDLRETLRVGPQAVVALRHTT